MKTILQVEDDPNDVFFLQHAMRKLGLVNPLHVATDGQQAIDYLSGVGKFADRERFPFPALVLLDLKLPYVMGLEVLRWIRQQSGPAIVVIMLTASAEPEDIIAAYRLGANAFLTKPSEASKFREMVKAIKDFWLTYNTLSLESDQEPAAAPAPARLFAPDAGSARGGVPAEVWQPGKATGNSELNLRITRCASNSKGGSPPRSSP